MATATREAGPIERRDLLAMVVAAVAVNAIGALGIPFTTPDAAWFAAPELPAYYPPNWAFGVVWPVLYALMGVAAVLVHREGRARDAARRTGVGSRVLPSDRAARVALGLFGVQLVVSVAWSPIFRGLRRPDLGVVVLLALCALVAATIVAFARLDRRAAACLAPSLAWIAFATALNYGICALN